jgi:L-malate glycosyltransferase
MSSEQGWRGGEQQLAYLLEDLSLWQVKNVLAVRGGSRLESFSHQKQIPCHTVKFSNSADIRSAMKVDKICRTEKIDLIHLHSSKAHGVGVLSTVFGNRVPMVLSRRVAFLPGSNVFSKWKYNNGQIKKILCVSQKIRTIMQGYVKDGSKCITVYSGIELNRFNEIHPSKSKLIQEFDLDPESTIIGTVGAIDKAKDHFTFVDTIEKLIISGARVQGLIIGHGPLASVLVSYIEEKKLSEYVRLAGQRNDVVTLLPALDMFLMTSREEGLGTSILDAFLARVPVVATDAGGIPEIVRNMETGMLAPVGDATKLSQQIERLLNDEILRKTLTDHAYAFVQKFSRQETSSRTLKVYQEVLNK